jgi:hypothetical protein
MGNSAGLVIADRVEGEFADQLAGVAADDADVQVVDEWGDAGWARAAAHLHRRSVNYVPRQMPTMSCNQSSRAHYQE